uniref:RING-type domain-containing protein n=1 Tax=viral metagenome TaxID=1070528 RepID=A0A6C0AC81_9ZZZZ
MSIKNHALYWDIIFLKDYNFKLDGKYKGTDDCIICLDTLEGGYIFTLPCGHKYHRNCFYEYKFKYKFNKCPDCHKEIKKSEEVKLIKDILKD